MWSGGLYSKIINNPLWLSFTESALRVCVNKAYAVRGAVALALHGEKPASLASRVPDGAQLHLVRLGRLCGALVVGVLLEELARLGRVALLCRVLL